MMSITDLDDGLPPSRWNSNPVSTRKKNPVFRTTTGSFVCSRKAKNPRRVPKLLYSLLVVSRDRAASRSVLATEDDSRSDFGFESFSAQALFPAIRKSTMSFAEEKTGADEPLAFRFC